MPRARIARILYAESGTASGVIIRSVGLAGDITDRVELAAQLRQKLESVGLLAGGIAHDFNNVLAVILVVDDDAFVRTSTSRLLSGIGYRVLESGDAESALEQLRSHREIELLVTDVVMPRRDGRELVLAARELRPDLAAMYTSGYTDDALSRHGVDGCSIALLAKPFTLAQLATKVRDELERGRRGTRDAA